MSDYYRLSISEYNERVTGKKAQHFDYQSMQLDTLWHHYKVYGDHDAAVEICDRAIADDKEAYEYAQLIWL